MRRFRSFNLSTCKTVLSLLEAVYLRLRKIVVERVTVVKFRVNTETLNQFRRVEKYANEAETVSCFISVLFHHVRRT